MLINPCHFGGGFKFNFMNEAYAAKVLAEKALKQIMELRDELKLSTTCDKNPLGLEIGKEYVLQYLGFQDAKPYKAKITHFTKMGFPWQVAENLSGIVSPNLYMIVSTSKPKEKNLYSIKEIEEALVKLAPFSNTNQILQYLKDKK